MLETIQPNLQIGEYVAIMLSFLGMKSTPGVFTYTGGGHGDLRCCGVDVFLMR